MLVWINNPFDLLPGEGARPLRYESLARALVARGHRIVWWTSDWSHIRKSKREIPPSPEGIEIRLIPTIPYFRNIGVRRFYSHWRYARTWLKLAMAETEMPDRIICSLPPLSTGLHLKRICRLTGAVAIIDVMDLWPETFARVLPNLLLVPLYRLAGWIYRSADGISAVGHQYLAAVEKRHSLPAGKSVHVCYHGIADIPSLRIDRPLDGPLRLVYIGNLSEGYDLRTVVAGVCRLIQSGADVTLDIAGEGDLSPFLKTAASKFAEIRIHGLLGKTNLADLLTKMQIGLIPMNPESCVAVPYKLADYAKYGLAVISSLNSNDGDKAETQELIDAYTAGLGYRYRDVEDFMRTVRVYLQDRQLVNRHGTGSFRLALKRFDSDRIYPEFCTWVENLSVRI